MTSSPIMHQKSGKVIKYFGISIILVLALGLLFYANYLFTQFQPGGTDFLHRWMPVRLILFKGFQNPYSEEVSRQVQLFRYGGRYAQAGENPCLFAYPFYIIPLYIPFSFIKNFALARAAWMVILELVQMSLVVLTLRLFKFHLKNSTLFLLLLFSMFCSYFTQPLVDGNPSPIAALFVLLSLLAISKEKDWQAGIFLALSTIKPQLVLLFFILIWFWAFSNRRWKIILGSLFSLIILLGISFAVQPSWFSEFIYDVMLYPEVASPHSPQTIMNAWFPEVSKWISLGLTIGIVLILGKEWIGIYKKNFESLFWVACLTFTLVPLSGITSAKSNFIAMLPGIVLIIVLMQYKWKNKNHLIDFLLILSLLLSWVLNYIGRKVYIGETRLYFIDFLPTPILIAALLYWVKANWKLLGLGDKFSKFHEPNLE